ncbi:hypothetical protein AAIG93_34490, partial [Pseudomonas aeruginosa]|uniref:hypothetical protein n=1 Tax=Pseudomonas aeruginosa TaxID=287 RepID=UPI0031B67179
FITIILTTKGGQKYEWIQKQFTERSGLVLAACRKPGRYSGGQWTQDGSGRSMATGCRCCAPDRLAAVCPKKGCTLPPALPGKGVTKKAAFITPGVRRLKEVYEICFF